MRHKIGGLGLVCTAFASHCALLVGAEPGQGDVKQPWIPDIQVEKYTLKNGLTVILHEDHKARMVAVNVTYNVGSKDDAPGRSGFAHLFEHMMFEGSEHHDPGFSGPIYRYMIDGRAETDRDHTVYYDTVSSNALERVLWLEADRMGFVLPAITPAKLKSVRAVVKNERRQSHDNVPLGGLWDSLYAALYPPGHPYRQPIIGSMADLSAAQLGDFNPFARRRYAPNNAFLCLAGDFDPVLAIGWIEKYFGPLRRARLTDPPRPDPIRLGKPRRVILTDQVAHAVAVLAWPTVPAQDPDAAALDVLASILGAGWRWNRLIRALKYDRQVASSVSASHTKLQLAGHLEITIDGSVGRKLEDLIGIVDAEINRLKTDGPTDDEVRRVKIEKRTSQIDLLDSVASKAKVLNQYAATFGDPLAYRTVLANVFAITPDDVKRVARAYLGPGRIELTIYPGERATSEWSADVEPVVSEHTGVVLGAPILEMLDRSLVPDVGPAPVFFPPRFRRRRLANGLDLLVSARHELPKVRLKLVVRSGETSSPPGKEGLSALTVKLLREGTLARDAIALERDVSEIGASLWTQEWMESSSVEMETPTRSLDRALDLFADVVLNPSFVDQEFLRLKLGRLEYLKDRAVDPNDISEDVFPRLLYRAPHPYGRPKLGTLETVRSITREDVVAFYGRNFVPANTALVIVGDVAPDVIATGIETRFGAWRPGPVPPRPKLHPVSSSIASGTIYLIDRPGAAQSVLSIGRIGAGLRSADRNALILLKKALSGRISWKIRDEKAYTYEFSETFDFREGAGPFVGRVSVQTMETGNALAEIFKQTNEFARDAGTTEDDLSELKDSMLPDTINRFETIADVAGQLGYLAAHRLPNHYFALEPARFAKVIPADVDRLARKLFLPGRMTVLVVGDRAVIEDSLRSLPFVKSIRVLDAQGNPILESVALKPAPASTSAMATSP
jgi:zinc protease